MTAYLTRRLVLSLPVLVGITFLTFLFANMAPGDPVDAFIDPSEPMPPEQRQALRENLGLNQPLPVRYVLWLRELSQGNLGYSFQTGRPVLTMVGEAMQNTLLLTVLALVLSVVIGVTAGIGSALKRYSWMDYTLTVGAFVGISIPNFFVGLLAIYVFAVQLRWFPTGGMASLGSGGGTLSDVLRHLALPTLVWSLHNAAEYLRYTRSSMLDVLNADYITVARAKGLAPWIVIGKHAFRNALLPIITLIGLRLPVLFSGSVLLEVIFSWPGMGQLAVNSIYKRDYPIIMGVVLVIAIVVMAANLLTDLLYSVADPRIRYDTA